jgi:small subunit ribosomal protein S20
LAQKNLPQTDTFRTIDARKASDPEMPNTNSAKKRLRQNEKLRLLNRAAKSNMRTQLRRVREAVQAGDSEKAQAEFRLAQKKIDRAASKNLIHKNAAARTKSRLVKLVKSVSK